MERRFPTPAACIYLARGLRDFGDGFIAIVLPVYLIALGLSAFHVGVVATLALGGSALLTLGVGLLGARHDVRKLLLAASALMVLGVAIMVIVLGAENKAAIYTSPDLKQWDKASEFGPAGATGDLRPVRFYREDVEGSVAVQARQAGFKLLVVNGVGVTGSVAGVSGHGRDTNYGRRQRRTWTAGGTVEARQEIRVGLFYTQGTYRPVGARPGSWSSTLNDDYCWTGTIDFNTRSSRLGPSSTVARISDTSATARMTSQPQRRNPWRVEPITRRPPRSRR